MGSYWRHSAFNAPVGNTPNASPQIGIPPGEVRHVQVRVDESDGPIRMTVGVFPEGTDEGNITLASGWARGADTLGSSGSILWTGTLPTGKSGYVRVFTRNDTGATVRVFVNVAGATR